MNSNKQPNLPLHTKEQINPIYSRRKTIAKIRAEQNRYCGKQTKSINCFFQKKNIMIVKPLAKLRRKERFKTVKSEMKEEIITIETTEIPRITRNYYEQLHSNKLIT